MTEFLYIMYCFHIQMWEKGIQLCKELAQLYEGELYDYERLSVILVSHDVYCS